MCVAYTSCEGGQPTFAIQISGALLGCLGANPEVDLSSAGLSEIIGEGVTLGLNNIGYGLSPTGEFEIIGMQFYSGSFDVPTLDGLRGNTYTMLELDLLATNPALAAIIEVTGFVTAVTQIGDGYTEDSVSNT